LATMKSLFIFLVVLFVALANGGTDPVPPQSWPPVFWSWMMTTIVHVKENSSSPIIMKGQFVVYDSVNQFSCRYAEQDLINTTKVRGNDFCDYQRGMHYTVKDTTLRDPNCSSSVPTNTHTIPPLTWPAEFLSNAKYLGTDKVNQNHCDHFFAIPVSIDGQNLQIDAWFTNDTRQWPCQISAFEIGQPYYLTWAFDAFNTSVPADSKKCTLPRLQCAEKGYRCHAKRGLDTDRIGMGLRFACDPYFLDCDSLNPGGENFEPDDVLSHADWAFNTYFQKYKNVQGEGACDFLGAAEMVPPSADFEETPVLSLAEPSVDPINWLKADLVCP